MVRFDLIYVLTATRSVRAGTEYLIQGYVFGGGGSLSYLPLPKICWFIFIVLKIEKIIIKKVKQLLPLNYVNIPNKVFDRDENY